MVLEFREPASLAELESLYRLRYLAYSDSASLKSMLLKTNGELDINEFDLRALHFGAFQGDTALAYFRMTTLEEQRFTEWTRQIAAKAGIQLSLENPGFPFEKYCPDKEWVRNFLSTLKGKKTGEAGRLAVHPHHRRNGFLLDQLISTFVTYCKETHQFDVGFGSCTLPLERYYRKFGFVRAERSVPFVYQNLPEAVIMRFNRE